MRLITLTSFQNSQPPSPMLTTQITAATVAASYPVAPGAVVVVTLDSEVAAVSCILAAGGTAGNVTFTLGNGL